MARQRAVEQRVELTYGGTNDVFLVTFDARGCSKPHGPCTSRRSMKRKDSFARDLIGPWAIIRNAASRFNHNDDCRVITVCTGHLRLASYR